MLYILCVWTSVWWHVSTVVSYKADPGKGRYWIISSELRRNLEIEKLRGNFLNYKVSCGEFAYKQLDNPEGTGGCKGAKAKNRIWKKKKKRERENLTTMWEAGLHRLEPWFFPSLGGYHNLHQQKAFFQFSYQMKVRVKVDRELPWLGHILCEWA